MPKLSRRLFLIALALLPACSSTTTRPPVAPNPNRAVVLVSIDGLAAFYWDDPNADMPNLRRLAADGARSVAMRPVPPTVTWPNHVSVATGVVPARHGVLGNNYLDRATTQPVTLVTDPVYDADQILRAPTIYDAAHAQGLTTAAVLWPASRNAKTLNWTMPDCATNELIAKYTTPSLLAELRQANIPIDQHQERRKADDYAAGDKVDTDILCHIIKTHRPRLSLLHIADFDHIQHAAGPQTPRAYASLKYQDQLIGQLWDTMQDAYGPGNATLVIVSDHGFSLIKNRILPNVVLEKEGLLTVKGTRVVGGDARIVTQGGTCFVYYLGPAEKRSTTLARLATEFAKVDGVAKVVTEGKFAAEGLAHPKDDPHAPDLVLYADDGYTFGSTAGGQLPVTAKSPETRGTHGHDPAHPRLQATFFATGSGIRKGVTLPPVRNTDVAPTIATLLDIPFPTPDGRPLRAALAR